MNRLIAMLLLLTLTLTAKSQNYILKAGDRFPDITLHPLVNAPVKDLYLNSYTSKKYFILNFWGTWCSPCIPEMDALAKLQVRFQQQIQIVGVADDSLAKLVKYNAKKPSKIWLVSDTAYLLYRMLNLASVGHCIIIDAQKNIVAVVKTDSVNAKLITRLLAGEKIASNADIAEMSHTDKDPFGVDSLQSSSFTIRSYMKGHQTMGRSYNKGPFAFRRKTYYNITPTTMYKDAYDIVSQKQVVYEFDKKRFENFSDKSQLYCFDLLVKPEEKDSLKIIMQRKLNESLPIKARTEMRSMPVYILKQKPGTALNLPESTTNTLDYSFSGNGFDGKAITIAEFTHIYLNNELELPVINETSLTKRYDIKTTNDLRDKANIINAVDKLGLILEKGEREVRVLILYR
ncbi:MAG: redoxin domain-containing protein [Mucilaginibacter sp.]